MVYDKAKWHYGGEGFPKEYPIEQGGVHIAFVFAWCMENGFMAQDFLEDIKEEGKDGTKALELLFSYCDGVFMDEDVSEAIQGFLEAYYGEADTAFAKEKGSYLEDYSALKLKRDKKHPENQYATLFNESNYKKVKEIIDKRYSEFLIFQG